MNNHEDASKKQFDRRMVMIGLLGAGGFLSLTSRLIDLQLTKQHKYKLLSDDNQFNLRVLTPSRGKILDRHSNILAQNKRNFRVLIQHEKGIQLQHSINSLKSLLALTETQIDRIWSQLKKQPSFVPVLLKEHLSWEQFAIVNLKMPEISGIQPDIGEIRSYPYDQEFCHIIGFVARPSESDLEKDPLLHQPGMYVGRQGLEKSFEKPLQGKPGNSKVEVNAYGRTIREWKDDYVKPKRGKDIQITLDRDLQRFASQEFKTKKSGAIIVLKPDQGDILVSLSTPGFDPNLFVRGVSQNAYQTLLKDEANPLFNKALSGLYPPASTFKMMVALAGLESGLITLKDKVLCKGSLSFGNRKFHCWKKQGHGIINLQSSIQQSCDIYYYELALKLGIKPIMQMARKFGIGQDYKLPIEGIQSAPMIGSKWKQDRYRLGWHRGDTLNVAIGQGYLALTPLELAVMTARLATGRKVLPRLFMENQQKPFSPLKISQQALKPVQQAMRAVCETPRGTAYRYRGLGITPGIPWAGKTGTAQVKSITKEERLTGIIKNKDREWRNRDHALFVGYAPYDKPQYVVSVVVEHGGGGASSAAPIASRILRYCLTKNT